MKRRTIVVHSALYDLFAQSMYVMHIPVLQLALAFARQKCFAL